MRIEFNINVADDGFFCWLLRTFGKRINDYWWKLFGFHVRENYTGAEQVDMKKTIERIKK